MDYLSQLAEKHKTDKGLWHHGYTPVYHEYFDRFRNKHMTLLEIGIGGYEYPDRGGESLRMWEEYFIHAKIYGMDIYPKTALRTERIGTILCSQTDEEKLMMFMSNIDKPFIIIDDGSHKNDDAIKTFGMLFPVLLDGGIYVVEDVETSYWEKEYGGGYGEGLPTMMNYFKSLCDSINKDHIPGFNPIYEHEHMIKSIHFYKGLIFILKK